MEFVHISFYMDIHSFIDNRDYELSERYGVSWEIQGDEAKCL